MGSKIKPRYQSLSLPRPGYLRFPPLKSVKKQTDAQYCFQIVTDALDDLRNNGPDLIRETFTSRRDALEAILDAIPYTGTLEVEERATHIRACLTIGWAVGIREEVSGLARPGVSEDHHIYALILAGGQDKTDDQDFLAGPFAFDGYFLAREGDTGLAYVRTRLVE